MEEAISVMAIAKQAFNAVRPDNGESVNKRFCRNQKAATARMTIVTVRSMRGASVSLERLRSAIPALQIPQERAFVSKESRPARITDNGGTVLAKSLLAPKFAMGKMTIAMVRPMKG